MDKTGECVKANEKDAEGIIERRDNVKDTGRGMNLKVGPNSREGYPFSWNRRERDA